MTDGRELCDGGFGSGACYLHCTSPRLLEFGFLPALAPVLLTSFLTCCARRFASSRVCRVTTVCAAPSLLLRRAQLLAALKVVHPVGLAASGTGFFFAVEVGEVTGVCAALGLLLRADSLRTPLCPCVGVLRLPTRIARRFLVGEVHLVTAESSAPGVSGVVVLGVKLADSPVLGSTHVRKGDGLQAVERHLALPLRLPHVAFDAGEGVKPDRLPDIQGLFLRVQKT